MAAKMSLRNRMLFFVGALVVITLLGSLLSLYRITQVSQMLDTVNEVVVPSARLIAQMESDVELYRREVERRLGSSHWEDPHWKPKPIPRWVEEVLENELTKLNQMLDRPNVWPVKGPDVQWREWAHQITQDFRQLQETSTELLRSLESGDRQASEKLYNRLTQARHDWTRKVQNGADEFERHLKTSFESSERVVEDLRTGLQLILMVVIGLSAMVLWLGERALRPLQNLTRVAKDIATRGLQRADKEHILNLPLARQDEVSQLAREFHHMATALLEREKMVELQKIRLEEQNRLLRIMGGLNENILKSMESALIVTDLAGSITQLNPRALQWLQQSEASTVLGTSITQWPEIQNLPGVTDWWQSRETLDALKEVVKPENFRHNDRVFGVRILPLQNAGSSLGAMLIIDDLTDDVELQERLKVAENLAAVGRMSAQVAHEVRNPLHSIGLEAEVALELAQKAGDPNLKTSLQSILQSVDRLDKITENYLKLSKTSQGEKRWVDVSEWLESSLATYANVIQARGVRVDWMLSESVPQIWGDPDLLEQVLGNLIRNSLQAFEERPEQRDPRIWIETDAQNDRLVIRVHDNGPGLSSEIKGRLFAPFATTKAMGTGLGLSFSKMVMEDHGGKISALVASSHEGACFELELPREKGSYVEPNTIGG